MSGCFECDSPADCEHHVVPRSRGGTKTVPLCSRCHGLAHHRAGAMSTGALTAAAMARKRAQGEYTGGRVPYGWTLDADGVRLVVNAGEQSAAARARELSAAGLSLRRVAAALESEGILAREGRRWHANQIRHLVALPE